MNSYKTFIFIMISLFTCESKAVTPADCAAYPIRPDCCTTPCMIMDVTKNADLLKSAENILSGSSEIDMQKSNANEMLNNIGESGLKDSLSNVSFLTNPRNYVLSSGYNGNIESLINSINNDWLINNNDSISAVTSKKQLVDNKLRQETLNDFANTKNYLSHSNSSYVNQLQSVKNLDEKDIRELMQKNSAARLILSNHFANIEELSSKLLATKSLKTLSLSQKITKRN